jgi:hypothetical protein
MLALLLLSSAVAVALLSLFSERTAVTFGSFAILLSLFGAARYADEIRAKDRGVTSCKGEKAVRWALALMFWEWGSSSSLGRFREPSHPSSPEIPGFERDLVVGGRKVRAQLAP